VSGCDPYPLIHYSNIRPFRQKNDINHTEALSCGIISEGKKYNNIYTRQICLWYVPDIYGCPHFNISPISHGHPLDHQCTIVICRYNRIMYYDNTNNVHSSCGNNLGPSNFYGPDSLAEVQIRSRTQSIERLRPKCFPGDSVGPGHC